MDDLIERLQAGCVYRPKRWSGDTHDDLGGPIDEAATESLLAEAAAALSQQRAVAWPAGVLNRDKTLEVLTTHNKWRRGAYGPQTEPRILGLALDAAIAYIAAAPSPEQEK